MEINMEPRYWLKFKNAKKWEEVSFEKWIKAERRAGFYPKGVSFGGKGYWTTRATAGFSGGGVEGRVGPEYPSEINFREFEDGEKLPKVQGPAEA